MPEGKVITSVIWSAQNLPNGLSIGEATGIISGTPTTPGQYTSSLTVTTNYGTDTKTISITVLVPDSWKPTIAGDQTLTLVAGEEMTPYTVLGTNISLTPTAAPVWGNSAYDIVMADNQTATIPVEETATNLESTTFSLADGDTSSYTGTFASNVETTTVPSWASIDATTGTVTLNAPDVGGSMDDTLYTSSAYLFRRVATNALGSASQSIVVNLDNFQDSPSITPTAAAVEPLMATAAPNAMHLDGGA